MQKFISLTVITVALIGCFPEVAAPSLARSMRMEAKAAVIHTDARPSEPLEHVEPVALDPGYFDVNTFTKPEDFPPIQEGSSQLEVQYTSWRKGCVTQLNGLSEIPSMAELRVGLLSGHLEVRNPNAYTIKLLKHIAAQANHELPVDPKFLALFDYQQADGVWRSDPIAFRLYAGTEVYAEEPMDIKKLYKTHPDIIKRYLARHLRVLMSYFLEVDPFTFGFLSDFLAKEEIKPEEAEAIMTHVMDYLAAHRGALTDYLTVHPDIPIMKRVFGMEEGFKWKLDLVRDWSLYSPEYRIDRRHPLEKDANTIYHDNRMTVVEPYEIPTFRNGRLFITMETLAALDFNAIFSQLFGAAVRAGAEGQFRFVPDVAELRDEEGYRLGCHAFGQQP